MERENVFGMKVSLMVVLFSTLGLVSAAMAAPVFYLSPGDNPDGDLAFQAALTDPLYEEDFETYPTWYYFDIQQAPYGSGEVVVDEMYVIDTGGNRYTDYGIELFDLKNYKRPPMINRRSLLNRTYSGGDVLGAGMEFNFAMPTQGFGTWILDDAAEASQYVLTVTEVGGATFSSAPLDSGNGVPLAIDGFIGVVSSVGIERAVLQQQTVPGGTPSDNDYFYLDHMQITVPEPVSLSLMVLGGLAVIRRGKRRGA